MAGLKPSRGAYTESTRAVVQNVYKFCQQEKENGLHMSLGWCLARTASMTGMWARPPSNDTLRQTISIPSLQSARNAYRDVLRRTIIDIYARKKTHFKMGRVNQLLYEGFASITPAIWKKCVEHVMCVEERYWAMDALVDDLRTPSSLR